MRWILALLTGVVVAAALTGWGHERQPASGPPDRGQARTAAAVADLTREAADPPPSPGTPSPGTGGSSCSSPFGGTRYGFEAACRRHDRGYALLRAAASAGHPLGPWARRAIDRRFAADLGRDCRSTGCLAAATVYAGAVRLNSWRQGDGVPATESGWAASGAGVIGGCAALLVGAGARARRRRPRLTPPVAVAGIGLGLSLQATTLPHPLWLQCLVGGLVTAQAYAAGCLVARLARVAGVTRIAEVTRVAGLARSARAATAALPGAGLALFAAGLAIAVGAAADGYARVEASVGGRGPGTAFPLLALAGSAAVAVATVRGGRALGTRTRILVGGLLRPLAAIAGRRAAAATAVPLMLLTSCLPVSPPRAAAGVSTDRSTWAAAGREGRRFLAATPPRPVPGTAHAAPAGTAPVPGTAHAASAGVAPVRVYVPRDAAASAAARARLAVETLGRAGGLDRSVLLVAVPTGSGWINEAAPAALENRTGGDVATVAVQYAASPSWLSYLRGGDGADESLRTLLAAVGTVLDTRHRADPARPRPRVLVYGESLGAWAGLRVAGADGIPAGADGALWVGVPAGSRPATGTGTPAARTGGVPAGPACRTAVDLTHPDDPVAAWSPGLVLRPSPAWRHPWLPVLSFWQASADTIVARAVPDGHGHRYGRELSGAWARVLTAAPACPPGTPAARSAPRLAA